MSLLGIIFDAVKNFIRFVGEIVFRFVSGIISLAKHVVAYFKGLHLQKGRDIPFLANANNEEFRAMLQKAPVKDVGIFQGTYNEYTNEIEHHRALQADECDEALEDALGDEPLVVLN